MGKTKEMKVAKIISKILMSARFFLELRWYRGVVLFRP